MTRRKTREEGFTLVEMIVAVAVFSIIMTIAIGTLLALADANKKAQALKSVMDNLNFAIENMSRNIRVGTDYHCETGPNPVGNIAEPQDCASGGRLFAFEANDGDPADPGDQIVYRLNGTTLERSINAGASYLAITAPEVKISELRFYLTGAELGDGLQPFVTLVIQGTAGPTPDLESRFNLEVSVSQRLIDF